MKASSRRSLLCLGLVLLVLSTDVTRVAAQFLIIAPPNKKRHYKHAPAWTPPDKGPAAEHSTLPPEEPPAINPEAMPSVSLEAFLNTHLDKILAPMGTPAFAQADLVEYMKGDYAGALPNAEEARKPAYQLAVAVCAALSGAVKQREDAVDALNGVYKRRLSEAIQPRGGKRAVKSSDRDEAFFYESQKNTWLQNAAGLRQQITALASRQRDAEKQAGEWTPPPPPAVAAAPTPTPAATPETDPVVGEWAWENNGPLTLASDGSISGSRHGVWKYTGNTNAGRNYEMHWKHKNWVDYMVLSDNGKLLDGKSKEGKHVFANR